MNGNLSLYIVSVYLFMQLYMHMPVEDRGHSQILLVLMYCVLCFETEASQSTNSRDLSASAFQYWDCELKFNPFSSKLLSIRISATEM